MVAHWLPPCFHRVTRRLHENRPSQCAGFKEDEEAWILLPETLEVRAALRQCVRIHPTHGDFGGFFCALFEKVAPGPATLPSSKAHVTETAPSGARSAPEHLGPCPEGHFWDTVRILADKTSDGCLGPA